MTILTRRLTCHLLKTLAENKIQYNTHFERKSKSVELNLKKDSKSIELKQLLLLKLYELFHFY